MKRLAQGATVALLITVSAGAFADTGVYLGGSIGSSHFDEEIGGFDLDTDTHAYRIFGGLQLGDTLGIEAGYLDFGDISETIDFGGVLSRTDISGDGWTLGATLGLPLGDNLTLFGRGGVFFWDADIRVDGFSIDTPGDENPYYGGGLKVDVGRHLAITGDWTRYELDSLDTDVISIGLEYRFGH